MREGLVEGDLALPPGRVARDQLADVARDGEMARRVDRRADAKRGGQNGDGPGGPRAETHDSYDYWLKHAIWLSISAVGVAVK
jgi:hypothetical protein